MWCVLVVGRCRELQDKVTDLEQKLQKLQLQSSVSCPVLTSSPSGGVQRPMCLPADCSGETGQDSERERRLGQTLSVVQVRLSVSGTECPCLSGLCLDYIHVRLDYVWTISMSAWTMSGLYPCPSGLCLDYIHVRLDCVWPCPSRLYYVYTLSFAERKG